MQEREEIYSYRRHNRGTRPGALNKAVSFLRGIRLFREINVPPWESIFGKSEGIRWKKESFLFLVWAFFLGRAVLLGEIAPFGPAFLAAVLTTAPGFGWFALAGLLAGQATLGWTNFLPAATVSLALFLLGRQLPRFFAHRWLGGPLLVAALLVVVRTGFLVLGKSSPILYDFILIFTEALLAGVLVYFTGQGVPVLTRLLTKIPLRKKEELTGFFVLAIGLLSGAHGIEIYLFSLHKVLGILIILIGAYIGGVSMGAVTGTLVGLIPSLTEMVSPSTMGFYAFAGVTAGLLRPFGRLGSVIGIILGTITLSTYFAIYNDMISLLGETGLAAAVFLLLPRRFLLGLKTAITSVLGGLKSPLPLDRRQRSVASRRIKEIARVFEELGTTFAQIAGEAHITEEEHLQKLFSELAGRVCQGCPIHRVCWEKEFYKTYRCLLDMLAVLEVRGRLSEENSAPELQKRCVRIKELLISLSCLYEGYRANRYWGKRVEESRKTVANQLQGLAVIMGDMAQAMKADAELQEDLETVLAREFIKKGIPYNDITVILNEAKKWEINISRPSCGNKAECVETIKPLVETVIGERLTVFNNRFCTKKTGEANCEFKLYPGSNLQIQAGAAQRGKEAVCGDSYGILELKDGKFLALLSDGMGVGSRAAMESRATISLLEQLMETGFGHDLAVRTVNSTLLLRSPEETFSTVDLAVIDLYSGLTDFVKIGATTSFIKRGADVAIVRSPSLPLGIFQNIEVECYQKKLAPGDILVMVSDGVLEGPEKQGEDASWLVDLLRRDVPMKPRETADFILKEALARYDGEPGDDMTVLVVSVKGRL